MRKKDELKIKSSTLKKKSKKKSDSYFESEDYSDYDEIEDGEDSTEWKIEKKKITTKHSFVSKEEEYEHILSKEDSLSDFSRLVELEKEDLYDYIFRMTGRCDDSWRMVVESCSAMQSKYKKIGSYLEFKITLYSTARNFAADDWNSPTEKLENPGYQDPETGHLTRSKQKIKMVEKLFQSIDKGWIKEALLLRYRYMFSPSEAATIMSSSVNTVKSFEETGLEFLSSKTKLDSQDIKQLIPQFPEYNYISNEDIKTRALSQVMGSIKKDASYHGGFWVSLLRIIALAAIGVGIYYLYDNYLRDIINKF